MRSTFKRYEALFAKTRVPAAGKPLCNNTRLFKRADDIYAVRLHDTDVVTVFANGSIALDTGGWYTMTTKDRITSYAPVTITSVRGVWYVEHEAAVNRAQKAFLATQNVDPRYVEQLSGGGVYLSYWNFDLDEAEMERLNKIRHEMYVVGHAQRVAYFDGIMFGPGGKCLNGIQPAQWQKYLRERNAMTKRIQDYCTKFNRALAKGIPMPSEGDCWYCSMFDSDDPNHLLSHMEEDYFVPSLAVNAVRAKGYSDIGVYMHLCMDPDNDTMGGSRFRTNDGSMGGNLVRRALRDYLFDRLLPTPPSPRGEQRALLREYKGACDY